MQIDAVCAAGPVGAETGRYYHLPSIFTDDSEDADYIGDAEIVKIVLQCHCIESIADLGLQTNMTLRYLYGTAAYRSSWPPPFRHRTHRTAVGKLSPD